MLRKLVVHGILFFSFFAAAQDNYNYEKEISQLVKAAKANDKAAIARQVRYPFARFYPIPEIKNPEEFVLRFEQIFDDSLLQMIATADIEKDWAVVGWRGAALNNGAVWVNENGLSHINYRTAVELQKERELIRLVRNALHPSLKEFIEPCWIIETEKFRIRIDKVAESDYRYASWGISDSIGAKPDLVISGGEFEFDGNGGNYHYAFQNGEYKYVCYRNYLRAMEDPDAELRVYKGDDLILYEAAKIVEYLNY